MLMAHEWQSWTLISKEKLTATKEIYKTFINLMDDNCVVAGGVDIIMSVNTAECMCETFRMHL